MDLNPILPASRIAAMKASGFWQDRVLSDFFDQAVAEHPDTIAVVDNNSQTGLRTELSYGELARRVDRIALNLARLGVRHGDVVSCQLPACWEFVAFHLACLKLGAATNALMPIFRERELEFMLGQVECKVLLVPKQFRGVDYPAMVHGIRHKLRQLTHIVEIGGDGPNSFAAQLLNNDDLEDYRVHFARPSPNDVIQLLFTSGTTGEPKGVMHTSNTILSILTTHAQRLGLSSRDTFLICTPIAHQTGFGYGVMLAMYVGGKAVMQDIWQPERAAELIEAERVSMITGATPFLADLTEIASQRPRAFDSMRLFLAAGAPIPRALVRRATECMGASIISGWGMTENGCVTTTVPEDPPEKTFETDGHPLPGTEVRVVDDSGSPLPPNQEGRLLTRGCSQFVGYLKRPHDKANDAQGWFDTGDMARMDADGYIRITGRSKDIIIRGGENISVVEVEGLIYRHPKVLEVAVVAMPDPRLGERACAFIVPRAGESLTLAEITAFLLEQKVAKQYMPERLEIIDEIPKTPSGKVQKFQLREIAKKFTPIT
ncbi:MAG: AMP-binding protein [Sulfuricaulis sp.]|nr:AMP-binding protein [Sulfuricaulis sp.]